MTNKLVGPKILTFDLETAPLVCFTWGIRDQVISNEQVIEDWSILSFSAKWLHDKKVIYKDTGGRGVDKVRDDKELVTELRDLLNEADIVITQNGKSFDVKKINSRILFWNLPPPKPFKIIDTKIIFASTFGERSNKLEHLTDKFTKTKKSKHKDFPGMELWKECLKDNPKAWHTMAKYNQIDVLSTEELYLIVRPWVNNHPNVATYIDDVLTKPMCPKCGSDKLHKRGMAITQTMQYHRYQCMGCKGWSRARIAVTTKDQKENLLIN